MEKRNLSGCKQGRRRDIFPMHSAFFIGLMQRQQRAYKIVMEPAIALTAQQRIISYIIKAFRLQGEKMIITNNELVYSKYKDVYDILFMDGRYRDVLIKTRDKVHEGYELLTHPLSSSIKPNETPYKSVIISDIKGNLNYNSVIIIEDSIMTFDKFNLNKIKNINEKMKEDFKLIDLTVLESALNI